ncbi:PREDICTED: E3 ubiquitin-protein ligase MIB2-like [Nicrophorus vespilloides]|uniref:E3 ubiquitin-protein ligase MIB2-like n=1 Tax=Nicrophorus vespilloides TaxID=110193 RepID=A0ABM1MXQ4_NICVS|nr:PREDICTED: E3 ubiquitin-protein ligase MIB2-like [Nicrophorus vespilloides]
MSSKEADSNMDTFVDNFEMLKTCSNCHKSAEENVTYMPCTHKLTCFSCSANIKKCYKCRADIESRVTPDGQVFKVTATGNGGIEAFLQRFNDSLRCNICKNSTADVAFICSHKACSMCSPKLTKCHVCKQDIFLKIKMF